MEPVCAEIVNFAGKQGGAGVCVEGPQVGRGKWICGMCRWGGSPEDLGFRFVHIADVHLESPFRGRDAAMRRKLRDAVCEAFSRAVQLAIDGHADAFLIAGDLFDSERLSFSAERYLMEALRRLQAARITVCYARGNHDAAGSTMSQPLAWPSNVEQFDSDTPRTVDIYRDGMLVGRVTGIGHVSPVESRNLVARFPAVADADVPHVGLVHAQVVGAEGAEAHQRYAPAALTDFQGRGYAYWALGHVHQRQQVLDNPDVWYPGNLQGRHPNETGPKGALWVEVSRPSAVQVRFVPLAPIVWERWEHVCDPRTQNLESLVQAIVAEHAAAEAAGERMVRLHLRGPTPLYAALRNEDNQNVLAELLQERLGLAYVEIDTTEVRRPIDLAAYSSRGGLLEIIERLSDAADADEAVLQQLAPDVLAGLPVGADPNDYLRALLKEAAADLLERLIPEDRP